MEKAVIFLPSIPLYYLLTIYYGLLVSASRILLRAALWRSASPYTQNTHDTGYKAKIELNNENIEQQYV